MDNISLEAIEDAENRLAHLGLYLAVGAELEVFAHKGTQRTEDIDPDEILKRINEASPYTKISYRFEKEETGHGQFELIQSHTYIGDNSNAPVSAKEAGLSLLWAQAFFSEKKNWEGTGIDYFTMSPDLEHNTGCGMHLNISIVDESGNNLLHNKDLMETNLLNHTVNAILTAQRRSFTDFIHDENELHILQKANNCPKVLGIRLSKEEGSVRIAGDDTSLWVESRLSRSSTNPLLSLQAICSCLCETIEKNTVPIVLLPADTEKKFKHNELPKTFKTSSSQKGLSKNDEIFPLPDGTYRKVIPTEIDLSQHPLPDTAANFQPPCTEQYEFS